MVLGRRFIRACVMCAVAVLPFTAASAQSLSVSEFLKLAPSTGKFSIRGFVVMQYRCPPCPSDAVCKPCMKNNLLIGEERTVQTTYPQSGPFVVVYTERPELLNLGHRYVLPVEVLPSRTTGFGSNDLKLSSGADALPAD